MLRKEALLERPSNIAGSSCPVSQPVSALMRRPVATFPASMPVRDVLDEIRKRGAMGRIAYFYVVDDEGRLQGVAPTRRLLTAELHQRLDAIMTGPVVSIPHTASVFDACELFLQHRYLALPVVDEEERVLGVIDADHVVEENVDFSDTGRIFESIGFRVSQVREASPVRAFRIRFPWLTTTILGCLTAALLSSVFETTLGESLALAFFLTLVLGLGESVTIQAATVTIHDLRGRMPTWSWYGRRLRREVTTASMLGLACGAVVGLVAWLWRGEGMVALVLSASLVLSISAAGAFGLSFPALLHALKLDPKIAAGPIALAITDISTVLLYFGVATLLL